MPRREANRRRSEGSRSPISSSAKATWSRTTRLARLTAPPQQPGAQGGGRTGPISWRRRTVIEVRTAVGAPPATGRTDVRISVSNEIELDAEVQHPSAQAIWVTVRISRDDAPDLVGKVRQISPQIDRTTQLGHVQFADQQSLPQGQDVRPRQYRRQRSCGVAVPRTAIDRLTFRWSRATLWRRERCGSD